MHVKVLIEDDFSKQVSCAVKSSILWVFLNLTYGKIIAPWCRLLAIVGFCFLLS